MGKLAEAYVDIVANTANLDNGLARAKAGIGSFVSFAGSALAKVGAVAGIGGMAGLGAAVTRAATKYADLAETQSKVNFVFKESSAIVNDMAESAAKQFGAIKKDSLDAAASFGLMAQAAGLSVSASAKLSAEFVKLGLDAASFFNVANEEAFTVLRSGLAGEAEPLRRFGVLLSDDAMRTEAVALGIAKIKRELTEQEKVQTRISLIRKGLAPATGDLERTSSSTANQIKKLQGDLENATAEFGKDLQGSLVAALKLARELGEVIRKTLGGADAGKALGDSIEAVINTGRVMTGQAGVNGGDMLGMSISSALNRILPGGDSKGFDDQMEKGFAGMIGKGQNFGAATPDEIQARIRSAQKSKVVAADLPVDAAERLNPWEADRQARAKRDAQAQQGADFVKKQADEQAKRDGRRQLDAVWAAPKNAFGRLTRLAEGLAKPFGDLLPGALSTDKATAKGNLQGLAQNPLVGAMGAFGGIALGALSFGQQIHRGIEHPDQKISQTFAGEDYGRHAIESALNSSDVPAQQLEAAKNQLVEQKTTNGILGELLGRSVNDITARGVFPR